MSLSRQAERTGILEGGTEDKNMNCKGERNMLKRTISFLLALCLCIGITAGTEVYAGDDKGTNDEENVGIGKMEDGDNSASEETIDLPQNGAKVQMDD